MSKIPEVFKSLFLYEVQQCAVGKGCSFRNGRRVFFVGLNGLGKRSGNAGSMPPSVVDAVFTTAKDAAGSAEDSSADLTAVVAFAVMRRRFAPGRQVRQGRQR